MAAVNTDLNILVVDDEHFIRHLTCRALGGMGFTNIASCDSGRNALSAVAANESIDIIICDLQMPGIDGLELLRRFKEAKFNGSLIVSTGKGESLGNSAVDLAQALKLDVLGALPKPLRLERLRELLGRHDISHARTFAAQDEITESELRAGLSAGENGSLTLYYQPKVHLQSGRITGVETLARWHHPDRGMLGPGAFIPLAERSGHIGALTLVISKMAIRQTKRWRDIGYDINTAINVSMSSLHDAIFGEFIMNTAREEGLDPRHINIEVTESQSMGNPAGCLEELIRLRMNGFGLSIDDFGTGYSSMTQLKKIPFTELKIDREFVSGAIDNASARAILESSVELARKLDMDIIAEGAETKEEWDLVAMLGCEYCQGYYSARPMPARELQAFMESWDDTKFRR